MAWTAPRTWTTSELVSAALMNAQVRDNLLLTLPGIVTTAGDLGYGTAANATARLAIGAAGEVLRTNSGATAPEWAAPIARTNLIADPGFDMWSMATAITAATTPVNSDDTYVTDVWNLLSDGNDIVDLDYDTTSPLSGSYGHFKATVQTANKKFGVAYYLEGKDAVALQDKTVSFSIQVKTDSGNEVENVRVAILSWTGTEDSVTSDVVSAWNAEGADPTWATNWTCENTPGNTALTTSWAQLTVENVSMDTNSIKNACVFIWVDDTDCASSDVLRLDQAKLEVGASCSDYIQPAISEICYASQRYFERHPDVYESEGVRLSSANATAGGQACVQILSYLTKKRVKPTWTVGGTWANTNTAGLYIQKGSMTSCTPGISSAAAGAFTSYINSSDDYISIDARL